MAKKEEIVPMPKSRFLEVECKKCKENVVVFSKSATYVKCKKCGEDMAVPSGGKVIILGRVKKVLA